LIARKDPTGDGAVSVLEWEEERDLADYLLSEKARGIDLSEFVILARSVRNPKTQKFLQGLDDRGIPFLLGSGGRFYEDPRVLEAIAFLKGWLSTENTIAQATALRSPWIGVPDAWLLEKKGSYFKHFFEEFQHPVAMALRDFYLAPGRTSTIRPGQILAELLKVDGLDEELYTPLVSLWHKVEEWSRQGLRFEAVVRQLTDAVESGKIEKEIPSPAEKGMVRVMTVHGSKGLQFPRVILLDFEGPSRSSTRSGDLIWDRKLGVHLLNRDEDGAPLKEDSQNLKWKELEKQSAIAESKRVFYVALQQFDLVLSLS
jgi:ATP-dependent exoDNAse (exonuclease V) beta subunit